jgi:hypothetical protein
MPVAEPDDIAGGILRGLGGVFERIRDRALPRARVEGPPKLTIRSEAAREDHLERTPQLNDICRTL